MATRIISTLSLGLSLSLIACSAANEQPPPPDMDGGVPDTGMVVMRPDTGPVAPPNDNVTISGTVNRLDSYLAGDEIPVGATSIQALGVVGVPPVATSVNGTYELSVPQNGQLLLAAAKPGYYLTHQQVTVGGYDINDQNFLLAYEPHIQFIADQFQVDLTGNFPCHAPNQGSNCNYAVVMGRVVDDGSYDNGTPTPMADVLKDEFTISGEGDPNWYRKGPYFLLFSGTPDTLALGTSRNRNAQTNKYEGGLFVFFVEIPVDGANYRAFEVSASSYAGQPERHYFGPVQFQAFRDGFTWVNVPELGVAPPPPPPPPGDYTFAGDIYPLLDTVNNGGYGCAGCHTSVGGAVPAGGLDVSGGPDQAYQGLDPAQYPQRCNVANPGASYMLTKPLYEANGIQDHPIFAFVSPQDPAYVKIYGWISAGAVHDGNLPPPEPVSFQGDILPILQTTLGCQRCHIDNVNAQNAPGGLYLGATPLEIHQALTQDTPTDNGQTGEPYRVNTINVGDSLLLKNPLVPAVEEPHPGKLIPNATDPYYLQMYQWIYEGAEYN